MKSQYPTIMIYRQVFFLFVLIPCFIISCSSPNEVGELVGVHMSFGLSDYIDGEIDEADFGGVVIVQLDDGTKVDAIWDNKLGAEMIGGMKLEIAPTKDPDYWKVVRIVETPPKKEP
ncbi:MAG: hypothetical protein KAW61_01340 [candidate division Zixibacteria bacterium]|nr:hypothetical protein [candidate division Zixibacteria bacterium]